MSRSKLFALARSITLLASVGAPCLAQAADLLPPPPPPPAPVPVDVGGGWYLRGDVGAGATDYGKAVIHPASVAPDGYHITNESMTGQYFAGGGVGYEFNSFLRAEVTGEYRGGGTFSYVEQFPGQFASTGFDPIYGKSGHGKWGGDGGEKITGYTPYTTYTPGTGIDRDSAHLSTVVVMASGLIDLGTYWCMTPYIGGGAGVAFHHVSGWTDMGAGTAAGGFGTAKDKDTTSFAWNAQAGLSFAVTPQTKIDVGYRYSDLGHASTGKVTCYNDGCSDSGNYSYKIKDITSHDVKIGVRYLLGGGIVTPLPPLAPAYEPAPGPIVRKY